MLEAIDFYEMGQQAAKDGKQASPALDANFMNTIADGQYEGSTLTILTEWTNGWYTYNANN